MDTFSVIKGNGCNVGILSKPGCFNIEIGYTVPKMRKEAPLFVGRESFTEKLRPFVKLLSGFLQQTRELLGRAVGEAYRGGDLPLRPVVNVCSSELLFCFGAYAWKMNKAVAEHGLYQ